MGELHKLAAGCAAALASTPPRVSKAAVVSMRRIGPQQIWVVMACCAAGQPAASWCSSPAVFCIQLLSTVPQWSLLWVSTSPPQGCAPISPAARKHSPSC